MGSEIKILVRGYYDIQKLRIQFGNRLVVNFKAKLGQSAGKKEDELSKKDQQLLKSLRLRHKKITDGITSKDFPTRKQFKGDEVISSYAELVLLHHYIGLENAEERYYKDIGQLLVGIPIYDKFLKPTKGIGPAMAGVIIAEFDIHKAEYPSSLHMYAGLDVAPDGKGRSMKKDHLVDVEYEDKDGNLKTKKSITFNPFIKSKLLGVLGPSFIKIGRDRSEYAEIYYNYKHRLEHHATYKDTTKLHRHRMAVRYMIKRFLVDLYTHWRELEGLPVSEPYEVAKLGIEHRKAV